MEHRASASDACGGPGQADCAACIPPWGRQAAWGGGGATHPGSVHRQTTEADWPGQRPPCPSQLDCQRREPAHGTGDRESGLGMALRARAGGDTERFRAALCAREPPGIAQSPGLVVCAKRLVHQAAEPVHPALEHLAAVKRRPAGLPGNGPGQPIALAQEPAPAWV